MMPLSRRQLAIYAVDEIVGGKPATKLADKLAAALIASGKQKESEWLMADIEQELESRGLYSRAAVTTANELSAKLKAEITVNVQKAVQVKDVHIEEIVDRNMIGGLRVETANRTWDNTIARELAQLKGGI